MSSNIRIQRVCQHCGNDFIAKTTVTRYCSGICSKRAGKTRKRIKNIEKSNKETRLLRIQPIEELNVKAFLSIAETCKLIGVSRRTIYRMIDRDELKIAKVCSRTIIRRCDIDNLFNLPKQEKPKPAPQPIREFYTVREIEEKYFIKYTRLNEIIKEKNIPKTIHYGKLYISKPHIDRYFKRKRPDLSSITEWYTVKEIQDKYGLTRAQVYDRASSNCIPRKRIGKFVKISKSHFDELFEIIL